MREVLTKEQIEKNKSRFLGLVASINVEGILMKELLTFLEKSDFFEAPASTMYHASYPGGLCQHSLNVYDALETLIKEFGSHYELNPKWTPEMEYLEEPDCPKYILRPNFDENSIKIVALFHDLSKANYYDRWERNVNTGEKDEKGRDIWIKVPEFKVKEGSQRFVGVNHEVNSYILASRFIPMSEDELIAICNHHCCTGDGNVNKDLSYILDKHPLTTLLHMADFLSTYITESVSNEQNH